jgi:hypothetical protein|tara:strand:+ start:927 stop:1094 length:168 start_codon:yes stop_codon:yes gene_type:complete
MNTIIKYLVIAVAFYCSINWLADNPNIIVDFRDKMNEVIGIGTDKAKGIIKEKTK